MTGVPWRKGEPSRPTASCVRCDRAGCGDTDCSNRVAFLCRIPAGRPLLRLRGLCLETGLETAYYPDIRPPLIDAGGSSQGSTELVWIGLSGTYIRYNASSMLWEARRLGSIVVGSSKASQTSLLLGLQGWQVLNDNDCFEDPAERNQSLATCSDTEFNCDDGSCISWDFRSVKLSLPTAE